MFRVITIESSDQIAIRDFSSEKEASRFADDACSEDAINPPLAYVFSATFDQVHKGRPYNAR
jgi:hypothetical protein